MATFPNLKTSAVAQYPAQRTLSFQNQALRFLDGTEQRYRDSAGPLHRWVIRLSQLDEGEAAALDAFLAANQGAFVNFAFTDPWDGQVYQNCSLSADEMDLTAVADMSGKTVLTVVENRV
ncbi:MAG TPA: DUF2460 domain-containing protein [Bryobacteraceae bacterium]|nr:DUF2460 domain-containing protein [Bryobacteraceae bacterium]